MNKPNIVTCFPLSDNDVAAMKAVTGDNFQLIFSSQDEINQKIMDADIFCGHAKQPVDWEGVVRQGRLKWIQSTAAGLDHCLVPSVTDSEILVSGCSGLFAPQVAEQTMALLFGLVRSLPVFFRAKAIQEFVRRPTDELRGKTVGIVGLGGNGQKIAEVLRPFCSKIVGTDYFPQHCQKLVELGRIDQVFAADELETMLPRTDVVIVTLPLSEENENRIGERQFALMKPNTYFINVGRGSVVNTAALIASLQAGHLAAAGIDVVDPEPLPVESPLWNLENVLISPHVGAQSKFRVPDTIDLFRDNLARYVKGESLLNQVDKKLGFPRPAHRIEFF